MNEASSELEEWSRQWTAVGDWRQPSSADLARRSRRYLALAVVQWATGVVFLAAAGLVAVREASPPALSMAAFVWILVPAIALLDLRNRRGTWRARAGTTREFVALRRRRLEARLRALWIGWAVLAAEIAFFIPWLAWVGEERGGTWDGYALLVAMVVVFGGAMVWLRRKTLLQLRRLVPLERELQARVTTSR